MITIAVGLAVVAAAPASGAVIKVTTTKDEYGNGAKCSLREAIEAANDDAKFGGCPKGSGADVVRLGAATYRLSRPGTGEDGNVDGDLDSLKGLTVAGRGRAKTTIDGNGNVVRERILEQAGGTLTVRGLTLRNADAYANEYFGAAVANESATGKATVLANVAIEDNYAFFSGGGVFSDAGPLKVTGSRIADNDTDDYGGGIYAAGPYKLTIKRSQIAGNLADDGGGGVYVQNANTVVSRSVISGNAGYDYGGGIFLAGSSARISNSTISGNYSYFYPGGGLYIGGVADPVVVTGTTFSENHAYATGGAIYAATDVSLRNSTITRNVASDEGGGIYMDADADLRNVTVARNYADDGFGGIATSGGTLTYRNSIIALNRASGDGGYFSDCETTGTTSLGRNLIGDGTCNTIASDLTAGVHPLDPRLGLLTSNGGPTQTLALLPGSPAIDRGKACLPRDQRGVKRKGRGKRCDIGAFER